MAFTDVVHTVREAEARAKRIRKIRGDGGVLQRNKKAATAELRGMTLAFLEKCSNHAGRAPAALPICEASPKTCRMCATHRSKIADLQKRNAELESNVVQRAATLIVNEARRNVDDDAWTSTRRRLSATFHPDKLQALPVSSSALFKAMYNHPLW